MELAFHVALLSLDNRPAVVYIRSMDSGAGQMANAGFRPDVRGFESPRLHSLSGERTMLRVKATDDGWLVYGRVSKESAWNQRVATKTAEGATLVKAALLRLREETDEARAVISSVLRSGF